ncbi:MAG: Fic family protein [bacterium]|nr:Fic family protein [bacterium]
MPLRPQTAKEMHLIYLAKGAAATTAIEGNSLSEEQVLQHMDGTLKLPPSKEYLAQEVGNIITACNQIGERLRNGNDTLTPETIKEFNKQALDKLTLEKDIVPGEIRRHSVVVGNIYRGAPAEDCEYLLEQLCQWLNGDDFKPAPGMETVYAIIKAVVAHIYLAWIHPFGDGNGRTARLVEFQILLSAGVPTPAAHLLSNHYNQTRTDYYRQLDSASKSGGEILPFLAYAAQGFVDGLREQLERIRNQQWDVTWENYVHDMFHSKISRSDIRQRNLVLDISDSEKPVPPQKIAELSPRLAKAYASKTYKTIQRDLNTLEKMNLVERTADGIRAKKETILAFLPWKKEHSD